MKVHATVTDVIYDGSDIPGLIYVRLEPGDRAPDEGERVTLVWEDDDLLALQQDYNAQRRRITADRDRP